MFIPSYNGRPLMFVTSHFYIYFRYFYAVYERLLCVSNILKEQRSAGVGPEDTYYNFLKIV
jgi:histone deacetylase complex regulatory component SIN3